MFLGEHCSCSALPNFDKICMYILYIFQSTPLQYWKADRWHIHDSSRKEVYRASRTDNAPPDGPGWCDYVAKVQLWPTWPSVPCGIPGNDISRLGTGTHQKGRLYKGVRGTVFNSLYILHKGLSDIRDNIWLGPKWLFKKFNPSLCLTNNSLGGFYY